MTSKQDQDIIMSAVVVGTSYSLREQTRTEQEQEHDKEQMISIQQ